MESWKEPQVSLWLKLRGCHCALMPLDGATSPENDVTRAFLSRDAASPRVATRWRSLTAQGRARARAIIKIRINHLALTTCMPGLCEVLSQHERILSPPRGKVITIAGQM